MNVNKTIIINALRVFLNHCITVDRVIWGFKIKIRHWRFESLFYENHHLICVFYPSNQNHGFKRVSY